METNPVQAEVVNALIEPLLRVLRDHVGVQPTVGRIEVISTMPRAPCLSVAIEVHGGGLLGPITWDFDPAMASIVAERMFSLPAPMSYDSSACVDAVSELANIIVGNATGSLAEAGYDIDVVPPRARIRLDDVTLAERTLAITVNTKSGTVSVMIGVHKA